MFPKYEEYLNKFIIYSNCGIEYAIMEDRLVYSIFSYTKDDNYEVQKRKALVGSIAGFAAVFFFYSI